MSVIRADNIPNLSISWNQNNNWVIKLNRKENITREIIMISSGFKLYARYQIQSYLKFNLILLLKS